MTNMRDVVVSVEITPALIVVEILHRTTHDVQRLLIRNAQVTTEQSRVALQSVIQSVFHPCKSVANFARSLVG